MSKDIKTQNDFILRRIFKRFPKFYYFVVIVFGPTYFAGLNPKDFLKKYNTDGLKLNLGSGPKRISSDVKNVDIHPYIGVDIVSDIAKLPIDDNSVSMIISDNVFEHLSDVGSSVLEVKRVLKKGGYFYLSTPFVYPYHPSPYDYTRWTMQGLENLFPEFEVIEKGVRTGIASTFSVYLCYFAATIFSFGSKKVFELLVDLSLLVVFPIKFLDIILNKFPFSHYTASTLYIVFKKND